MKIIIDIPKEFESDYKGDLFKDFFSRVLCDIEKGKCLCGSYEIEIAEMFLKAFDESKTIDNIVAELEKAECRMIGQHYFEDGIAEAITILKRGGAE